MCHMTSAVVPDVQSTQQKELQRRSATLKGWQLVCELALIPVFAKV